jgi:DNA-binding CsgD family transcriptional regulator
MSDSSDALRTPAARRDRSISARRAGREKKAERERRIMNLLNAGVSVDEIAARERLLLKRTRNLVREILARRIPQPPAAFVALQVSGLGLISSPPHPAPIGLCG